MVIAEEAASACIDEQTALDFVRGRLPVEQVTEVDEHADACARCQAVLAEASRAFRERLTGAPPGAAIPLTRFAPGDKLASRYRILRFIARGGMGEVYEAHDLILNTRLALKTLAATISDDPNAIRRLKQEVNLARLITHPNVCRIFDIGVHEQSLPAGGPPLLFITMELVSGESLGHRLRTGGRVTPEVALPIAQAMTSALGAAHVANVVHRDFKSDNVMLSPDEAGATRTVVMDFGLARAALGSSNLVSVDNPTLAGTLAYMAPEQLEGKPVGPASDIYALGVVMFEMLTGELPFKGEPTLAAAWRRVAEPAPSLSGLVPNLDRGWQRIVAACLERNPHNRPASADDVARALQELDTTRAREPEKPSRSCAAPRDFERDVVRCRAGGTELDGREAGARSPGATAKPGGRETPSPARAGCARTAARRRAVTESGVAGDEPSERFPGRCSGALAAHRERFTGCSITAAQEQAAIRTPFWPACEGAPRRGVGCKHGIGDRRREGLDDRQCDTASSCGGAARATRGPNTGAQTLH